MTNFARILVADDLSRQQKTEPTPALEVASDLAARLGSEIHLVHAYHIPEVSLPAASMVALEGPYVDAMRSALEGETETLRARRPELKIVSEVREGETVDVLIDDVTKGDCKLAVLGTHGRKGARRALLGSVTEKFIGRSPVPVLTINPHTHLESNYRPSKIVVSLDLNKPSDAVLAVAAEFAQAFGASLVLLHVVEEWAYPFVQSASLMAGGVFFPLERDLKEEANNRFLQLKEIATKLPAGIRAEIEIVEQASNVADAIIDGARKVGANMILMGHYRRGAIQSAMLGSVNRAVVREAECPVLTVSVS